MNTDIKAKICADLEACMDKARRLFPDTINMFTGEVRMIRSSRTLGMCSNDFVSRMNFKFNIDFAEQDYDTLLNDTIPHEVAHAVVFQLKKLGKLPYNVRVHGKEWRRVATILGCRPRATTSTCAVLKSKKTIRRYQYRLGDGKCYMLSAMAHNRIQRGTGLYRCKTTMKPLLSSDYTGIMITR